MATGCHLGFRPPSSCTVVWYPCRPIWTVVYGSIVPTLKQTTKAGNVSIAMRGRGRGDVNNWRRCRQLWCNSSHNIQHSTLDTRHSTLNSNANEKDTRKKTEKRATHDQHQQQPSPRLHCAREHNPHRTQQHTIGTLDAGAAVPTHRHGTAPCTGRGSEVQWGRARRSRNTPTDSLSPASAALCRRHLRPDPHCPTPDQYATKPTGNTHRAHGGNNAKRHNAQRGGPGNPAEAVWGASARPSARRRRRHPHTLTFGCP